MPWTNSYGQQLHPPKTPYTDNKGILTKDGRYQLLSLWTRTGGGTGIVAKAGQGLAASGSHAGDAYLLQHDWNTFATVPAGAGCKLPVLSPGQDVQVFNEDAANAIKCYPQGQAIDALGANIPYVIPAGKYRVFQCNKDGVMVSTGN